MKHLTKAYLALLSIFAVVLTIGSVKTTLYPDESVYAPGKVVALYNPDTQTFKHGNTTSSLFAIDGTSLAANSFSKENLLSNNCQ